MDTALDLARRAEAEGEVPIGAVIIKDDQCIAEGWNCPISEKDPSAHAEINALRIAASELNNYRLLETTLYVTLEPCVMCAGAIIHARVSRVVFGAYDTKGGAAGSVFNVLNTNRLNHHPEINGGVMETACSDLLQTFFKQKR